MHLRAGFRRDFSALSGLVLAFSVCAAHAASFKVDRQTVARASMKPDLRATHAPFPDRPVITDKDAGLVGDGRTDNTGAFKRLFSKPGQSVRIGAGDFLTGRFVIPGDTLLTLDHGTIIRDSGHLGKNERFIQIWGNHVKIVGNGARVLQNRADYTSGEGRHGIYILKDSDVLIDGLESSNSGGDGFYIGGPANSPSTNITLINCTARNNRRQGLSIVNARNVDVIDSTFSDTNGTIPEFGIDLEPNFPTDVLDHILLYGVRTSGNHRGGISMWLNFMNSDSEHIDVEIVDHQSSNEPNPFVTSTGEKAVQGSVRYITAR
ncbi:MAG: right-handed parallel beta-helix repeat-containing protein [Steroidobacteraceae bacterium]